MTTVTCTNIGAAIGTVICPGFGTYVGIGIGLIVGAGSSYLVAKVMEQYFGHDKMNEVTEEKKELKPNEVYENALRVLGLNKNATD